jgi:hypothetical protein
MGTDIHLHVERRKPGGPWELVAPPAKMAPSWASAGCYSCKYQDEDEPTGFGRYKCLQCLDTGVSVENWYHERDYLLFAALADVRNGYGFAGCKLFEPLTPVAKPRGLPSDMSPEMAELARRRLEHTPTWLMLTEVESYDWDRQILHSGIVSAAEWTRWKTSGDAAPAEYCGGISGPGIEVVPSGVMAKRIAEGKASDKLYAEVSWTMPLRESVSDFLERIPVLRDLAAPGDVRLVMWFDS